MHLQRPDGGDNDGAVGLQARFAALDVEELLRPEIGAEARLGDDPVAELQCGLGGDRRVAAMRDVGERAAMDEGGVVLQRLHEVRRERILEQRRHGPGGGKIARGDRLLVARLPDLDLSQPPLQIGEVGSQAKDRHDLRGHGDVEARLAREAVGGAS
jgi:hypothetical protein